MKTTVLILLVFVLQAKASFFDDFAGAMTSVEKAFGKLLNDVVTDVKNTVHCTILAMEQVLVISGAVDEPSTNNKECYDHNDNSYNPLVSTEKDNQSTYSEKENINKQISSSISKVNETLINIFDNDGHERLNEIKKVLQNETDRLTEVSRLLRQELEKISNRIKNEYITSNTSSLESLWDNMKILHELEMNDKNSSEVNEIGQVLNEAINVLHVNTTSNLTSDEDKIKVIIQELEHDSHSNNITVNKIENELSEWNYRIPSLQNFSGYNISPSTSNIMRHKDNKDEGLPNYTSNITTNSVPKTKLSIEESRIIDNAINSQDIFSTNLGLINSYSTVTSRTDSDLTYSSSTNTDSDLTNSILADTNLTDSGPRDTDSTDPGPSDIDSTDVDSSDIDPTDSRSTDTYSTNSGLTDTDSTDPDPSDIDSTVPDSSDLDSTDLGPTDTGLTVPDPSDIDSTDSGPTDTGSTVPDPSDIDSTDSGPTDTGSTDPDPSDTDSTDSGPTDTGSTDPGPSDTDSTDSGSMDTDSGPTNTDSTESDTSDIDSTNADPSDIYSTNSGSTDSGSASSDLVDFAVGKTSKEERKIAIDKAKDIIENSANTDIMLDKLFAVEGNNHELLDFNGRK